MSSKITSSVSALPGNRTAVSPNVEVICSRLKKRVDCLSSEMSDAIHLRDDGMRRGQPQMDMTWLNKLKAREGETVDLQNKFNETCRGGGKNIFKAFRKLNKKVIACLKAVVALKKEANHKIVAHRVADLPLFDGSLLHNGDGISRSFETVLRHLEKDKPIPFSPSQLRTYTKDFSTRLGSGGFGVVYKGQFPNGVKFAVKVLHLKLEDNVASKQFLAEVGTMGRTYHQNLLRLYGYCSDKNMKALVYEYMANGSLYDVLFSNHLNLEWKQIYSIVTDTAKGLSYLHDNCQKHIIHLDIKPANVLIDSNLCPKVADFGLARQYNRDLSHLTLTGFKGTPGYAAPELWSYSPLPGTCKCDVYSYGMLLFKVLQRRKDWNIRQGEDQKLFPVEVLEQYKKGQLEKILRDCGIEEKDRENATKLVLVAFCCIQKNPQNRPSMSTVVKTLEGEIQAKLPSNLVLPQMFTSSGVASTALAEENMLFSTFSSLSITSDGDATTEESILLESRVSSETFPAFAEPIPGERQYPVQKPMVEINKKNQEKKDIIKPEVKKDEVTTVVLKVSMHCEDCALKIKKTLKKMEGVLSADADIGSSLVTVKCNIEPKKLVDRIRGKYKKHAVIMETEVGKKKQEKRSVEQDRKWEGKKEEGLGFAKTKSKMKIEKQLDTVKTKSEAKGVIEEEQCIGEPELLKEGQVSIKKEERRTKSKKKKEENLGTMETKSERKDVAEMKLKKEEEEIVIVKLEQVEKEEKEIAKAKAEEKTKGKEKIEEEKDTWEKKIKEEEEEENTEKNRGVEKKMPTWAMARPKEEFSNWREEMSNAYNLQNFSDENSYTCSIC